MKLWRLLAADAVLFVVGATTFGFMFSNDPTPGRYYDVAWWLLVASLVAFMIGVIVALATRGSS